MRLMYPLFSEPIYFEENTIPILVLENGNAFSKCVQELLLQVNGKEGSWILSKNFESISLNKNLELISDIFRLEINNKKVLHKIHENLNTLVSNEENYLSTMEIKNTINYYIEKLIQGYEFDLTFNSEFDFTQIFKSIQVELCEDINICEKLLEYFTFYSKFFGIKCFVLINFKSFVSPEDLKSFYQEIFYRKITLFMLENQVQEKVFPFEKIRIIDKDLCELKINY